MDWKVIGGWLYLGGGDKHFLFFNPICGRFPFWLYNMFQLGRFHHQPDIYWPRTYKKCLLLGQRCHPCHSSLHPFVILGRLEPPQKSDTEIAYSLAGFTQKKVVVNIVNHHVTAVCWGSKLVISMPTFNGILADGNYQALKKLSVRHRESTKDREGEKVKKLWWDNSSQEPVEVTNIPESLGIRVA